MAGSPDGHCGEQHHDQLEELRRRNEEVEMARAYKHERWLENASNAPPYVVSMETAQLCSRHSVPVEGEASLPKGWTRNAVNMLVALRLCSKECIDFIMRQWHAMSFDQKLRPKYSISAPYWHAMVDAG